MHNKWWDKWALMVSALLHGGVAVALSQVQAPAKGVALPEYQPFEMTMIALPEPVVEPEPPPPEPGPELEPEPEPEPPPPEPEPEPEPAPVVVKPPEPKKTPPKPKKEKPKPKKEKPKDKPKEKPKTEPKPQVVAPVSKVPVIAPTQSPAQSTLPAPKPVAPPAPVAKPQASGTSMASYHQSLGRAIYKNRPRNARQRGVVVVSFSITPSGEFVNIRLEQDSGNPALNEAALNAVRKTARFHAPPNGETLHIRQPIKFE